MRACLKQCLPTTPASGVTALAAMRSFSLTMRPRGLLLVVSTSGTQTHRLPHEICGAGADSGLTHAQRAEVHAAACLRQPTQPAAALRMACRPDQAWQCGKAGAYASFRPSCIWRQQRSPACKRAAPTPACARRVRAAAGHLVGALAALEAERRGHDRDRENAQRLGRGGHHRRRAAARPAAHARLRARRAA